MKIVDMTVCEGGNHVTLQVEDDDGKPRVVRTTLDALKAETEVDAAADAIAVAVVLDEVKRVAKDANAETFEEIKAAVEATKVDGGKV